MSTLLVYISVVLAVMIAVVLAAMLAAALARGCALTPRGGARARKKWHAQVDPATLTDALATARALGFGELREVGYRVYSPAEFERLGATNHRARLGSTLEEIFPEHDRPRGDADISAVKYHMSARSSPIVLLEDSGVIVLDGVHRLVAAYLMGGPIRALVMQKKNPD